MIGLAGGEDTNLSSVCDTLADEVDYKSDTG